MRPVILTILLLAVVAGRASADPPRKEEVPGAGPVVKGLKVHEWGVFRVHNDVELANADMRAIWDGLPRFVYGQVSGRDLPKHWRNVEAVDKPVIFFHGPAPLTLSLKIDFPKGIPAVWWPGTQRPGIREGVVLGELADAPRGKRFRSLEWKLSLKEPPVKERRNLVLVPVEDGHWVRTLRAVTADDVFAHVGEQRFGFERERFVYYDGLLPRGRWVDVTVAGDRVGARSRAGHPVFDLTVVDRRKLGQARVGRLARLEAGAEVATLEMAEPAGRWPEAEARALTDQLRGAGLHEDEAGSLVELWQKELFLTEGVTLFYRLPQEEYECLLPMTLAPRPERLVRVGLVVHPHCEPDLAGRVAGLVRDLDANDFATREQAQQRLEALGRAAFVHLVRMRRQADSPEVKRRLNQLLEKYEAERSVPK